MISIEIGEKLRTLRLRKKWSLREMEKATGIKHCTIRNMEEAGGSIKAKNVPTLCRAFGITPNELFEWVDDGISSYEISSMRVNLAIFTGFLGNATEKAKEIAELLYVIEQRFRGENRK